MADARDGEPMFGSPRPKALGTLGVHDMPAARGSRAWPPSEPACLKSAISITTFAMSNTPVQQAPSR
jgi:hypothetical protein